MPPILLAVDKTYPKGLMWFRRDLRVDDNAALYHALRSCRQVVCVFVFDSTILAPLPRVDRRVEFIRESLLELDEELRALGGGLIVRHAAAAGSLVHKHAVHPTSPAAMRASRASVRPGVSRKSAISCGSRLQRHASQWISTPKPRMADMMLRVLLVNGIWLSQR